MKILPIKPVENLAVRPVAIQTTLPDWITPTLPMTAPVAGGNTGIVPPYLMDRILAARTAVTDARQGADVNPGVVPPWLVDATGFEVEVVTPGGPIDEDTPRIL